MVGAVSYLKTAMRLVTAATTGSDTGNDRPSAEFVEAALLKLEFFFQCRSLFSLFRLRPLSGFLPRVGINRDEMEVAHLKL